MLTPPPPPSSPFANLPWTGKVRRLRNLREIFQLNYSFAPTLLSLCSRWNFSENSEQLFSLFFQPHRSKFRVVQYRTERCWHVRNFHSLSLSFHSFSSCSTVMYTIYMLLVKVIHSTESAVLITIDRMLMMMMERARWRKRKTLREKVNRGNPRVAVRRGLLWTFFKGGCFRYVLCVFALSKLDTCTGYLMWTLPLTLTERQPTEKKLISSENL